jgi:hypothetical protein
MRKCDVSLSLLLALAPLAACDTATELAAPADETIPIEAMADEVVADLTLEGYEPPGFDELAGLIPGFAGYWFDRQCNLHVRLTDLSLAERAKKLLEPILRAKLAAEPRCPAEATILVQGAEFSWKELKRWAQALRPAAQIPGVTRMGISVPLNRIVFVVTGRPPAHEVIEMAKRLNVPYFALKFMLDASDGSTRGTSGSRSRGG